LTTKSEEIIDSLVSLAKIAKKTEHQPGKIILEISNTQIPKLISMMGGVNIEEEVKSIPGYTNHKIKPGLLKTSLEIDYDPEKIPYDLWESLMEISNAPQAVAAVTDRLRDLFKS
jgi:hypothetical protein